MTRAERKKLIIKGAVKAAEKWGYFQYIEKNVIEFAGCSLSLIRFHFHSTQHLRNSVMEEAIKTDNVKIISQIVGLSSSNIFQKLPQALKEKTIQYLQKIIYDTI